MNIVINESICVGGGACVLAAPDVFDQRDEDGIVILLDASPSADRTDAVARAMRMCPARAISLEG